MKFIVDMPLSPALSEWLTAKGHDAVHALNVGLSRETGLRVIASGGVSSLDDIRAVKRIEPLGVDSVITGKAIYEGRLDLSEAIEAAGSM